MEYLSSQIASAISSKSWTPFKIKNTNMEISHLLFANYVLLFAKVDHSSTQTINTILHDFYQTSGMEVNLEKSKIWFSPQISLEKKKDQLQVH